MKATLALLFAVALLLTAPVAAQDASSGGDSCSSAESSGGESCGSSDGSGFDASGYGGSGDSYDYETTEAVYLTDEDVVAQLRGSARRAAQRELDRKRRAEFLLKLAESQRPASNDPRF